ncbi:replicative DNA helicase [Salinifilum aidingensis]
MTSVDERTHDNDTAVPPHDLEAEQITLGAMMWSSEAREAVLGMLTPASFYRPAHQAIYTAIADLDDAASPTDPVSVAHELERRQQLQKAGGAPYLHTLLEMVQVGTDGQHHAGIVAEYAERRVLGELGETFGQLARTGGESLSAIVDAARSRLDQITHQHTTTTAPLLADVLPSVWTGLEQTQEGRVAPGLPSGFADLDDVTNGWKPGQLIVIGARPGIGKSTFALDMARAAAIKHSQATLIFSLEMGRDELGKRLLSAESRVRAADMDSEGGMSDDDWVRMARTYSRVVEAPLAIDDTANITVAEIRSRARQQARTMNLGLIVVDYLQLVGSSGRAERREQEVASISRGLKLLAKELEIPIIAVSQLNRGAENRTDTKPRLADLRESGAVEQDSDAVLLLHRPDAAERDDPRMGEVDLILAKHRGGPTSTVTVAHQLHYSRFVDMAPE